MYKVYIGESCVECEDILQKCRELFSEFREVNAAGGLVSDSRGRHLMILRNGIWDLPKGHQEEGEDIGTTALREVEEETGVAPLSLGELICITRHCYQRDGIWHLKNTWWYAMSSDCSQSGLSPQTEEGISQAVWVRDEELGSHLQNTFPSIRDVFSEAGLSAEANEK